MTMNAPSPRPVAVDPITVEVLGSAFASIAEEMGEALVRASHSTNIKERRDCSTALFDTRGNTLCQAEHIPMHLGSFIGIIPHILKRHPVAQMRPGDMFIGNDAYEGGGTHLPDIVIAEPIFFNGAIIAWAVNTAHHADFADRGHAHIYQEGLRIPPIRLYAAGELQKDVQELILLNCQVPRERLSDLRAQIAANRLGVQRMQALCAKYGASVVLAAGEALQDYAERKMRAGIASIRDGAYRFTDCFDNPELDDDLVLSVEIEVQGDEMRLTFDGPPQVRAGVNMVYTALLSTVYYAVKSIVDPSILPNAGLARPLTVTAREGSVLNCVHPAAVNGRIATCQRVVDLIDGALAQAVPDRVTAAANGACASATFVGVHTGRWPRLGLSRDDRRRLRCARRKGRIGRRARPYDQHVELAGRGPRARISADAAALRIDRRFRRRRRLLRRHGSAPRLPCGGRLPREGRWLATPFLAVGAPGGQAGRTRRIPFRRRGGALRAGQRPASRRRDHRNHDPRRRRLWAA
jgi:N-methylhydantoinase B